MTWVSWGFDAAVGVILLGLAARIVLTRDLFEAIVLFVAFGLTLSLAWVRLDATDVALAEAALGAGVTGALFLTAFHRLARTDGEGESTRAPGRDALDLRRIPEPRPTRLRVRVAIALVGAALAGGLALVVLGIPARPPLLPLLVREHLGESGVSNPVTGVLLNFRAYDTLLEVGVLVVAMVAVWSLDRGARVFSRDPEELRDDPMLEGLSRAVVPLAGVTAVYLVWMGSHGPGGAFQAAALLAGAGVLLVAAGLAAPVTAGARPIRTLAVLGLASFTAVGIGVMPWTGVFLGYPPGAAYPLILVVEAVLTLSIAVILVELFVDVPAVPGIDPSLSRVHPTGDPLGRAVAPDGAVIRGAEEEA